MAEPARSVPGNVRPEVVRVDGRADAGGEDEPRVEPRRPDRDPFLELAKPVRPERLTTGQEGPVSAGSPAS